MGGRSVAGAALAFDVPADAPTSRPGLDRAVEIAVPAHLDAVAGEDMPDLDADEAWALVRSLAADLDEDQMDAEGVSPGAGAAERLTQQLTEAERIELARLLQEQLRLAGAAESVS